LAVRFFWTEEADRQYLKHYADREARRAFDDLLGFIEDDPTRGSEIRLIELSGDEWERRAAKALRGVIDDARLVMASVHRSAVRSEPHVLAAVVHSPAVPPGVAADHTIYTLGLVLRTNKFD
jgi:hypothetical protein